MILQDNKQRDGHVTRRCDENEAKSLILINGRGADLAVPPSSKNHRIKILGIC